MKHTESSCVKEMEHIPEKPEIVIEEDRPFCESTYEANGSKLSADNIPDLLKLNDQKHNHNVEDFKNSTGKHILYGCLLAVAAAAIADAIWHPNSSILNTAVELAKIVATTILGYFFGSKSK